MILFLYLIMKKKNTLLIVILFFTTLCITAQPTIEWQKSLGGTGNDYAHSIQQTFDGGYIVAGYSNSIDGDVIGNHGSSDFWVVKLTSLGGIDWHKTFGGDNGESLSYIYQTIDSGYVLCGYSQSNNGDVTSNHGGGDYWVVKINSLGFIEWEKSLGGSVSDDPQSIQQTTDGGYIVAGYSWSNDGDVTGNHGGSDYWVVKLSSFGIIEWQKSLGGSNEDYASFVQETIDGGYILSGRTYSNDGDVTSNHGFSDCWIVKLTSLGDIDWQKAIGGSTNDEVYSIKQTSDGGYIFAGSSQSIDGDLTVNHGYSDYWVVKLTSLGIIEWQKSFGGSADDIASSIQQTTDNGYIVAGRTGSDDGDVTSNQGLLDCWLVKLTSLGSIVWEKSLGGSNFDFASEIKQTSDGGYIIAGYSQSNDGDLTNNYGQRDFWVVKLSSEVGLNEILEQNLFSVFPCPANNQITINVAAKLVGERYAIYDAMGKKVLSGKLNTENTLIELGNLSGGIYLVCVGENMQQKFKLIKE